VKLGSGVIAAPTGKSRSQAAALWAPSRPGYATSSVVWDCTMLCLSISWKRDAPLRMS
jgi:hypothetical protein